MVEPDKDEISSVEWAKVAVLSTKKYHSLETRED